MLTVSEAASLLRRFQNVLILTHVRPDGDTIGCAAALCAALRATGITAYLLPNPELTELTAPYFQPYAAPDGFRPDKVVSVDVATTDLLPENAKCYIGKIDLALDHHLSFQHFGRANLVRPEAAACGELLYDILSHLGPITPKIALPLYAAVATDTGCFAYSNTTSRTHSIAAALINTGIDFQSVNKRFFQTKTRKRLELEAAMLSAMEFHDGDRIAVLSVPLSLMERFQATERDAEDLSALGAQIEGVDCAITMRERKPNVWKISLRTSPRVNATNACVLLGGGGHSAAAGCTVEATWEEAKLRILAAVEQSMRKEAQS